MLDIKLIRANEDIITVMGIAKSMGWGAISEQTFHRILYLVQVLYTFKHEGENIFSYYHFTVTTFGPYSDLIARSLAFLNSSAFIVFAKEMRHCFNAGRCRRCWGISWRTAKTYFLPV